MESGTTLQNNGENYRIEYLPLFQTDLFEVIDYIRIVLKNPSAAEKLLSETEQAILARAKSPEGYEPFRSSRKRRHDYYRIYVDNFIVYYVLIGNVMEVRRFLFAKRDQDERL